MTKMTGELFNTWMPQIHDAVMRRIDRGQSIGGIGGVADAVTANEILDELQPPPDLRKELVMIVRHTFAALRYPHRPSRQR